MVAKWCFILFFILRNTWILNQSQECKDIYGFVFSVFTFKNLSQFFFVVISIYPNITLQADQRRQKIFGQMTATNSWLLLKSTSEVFQSVGEYEVSIGIKFDRKISLVSHNLCQHICAVNCILLLYPMCIEIQVLQIRARPQLHIPKIIFRVLPKLEEAVADFKRWS